MATILDKFRLDGRRALITGGARGLGRVIAEAFAEAGADVAVASRSLGACQTAAAEIAEATKRRTLGPIDILVNNAGINVRGAAEQLSEADWDAVIATNLKAPFLCSRAVGVGMRERGWGRVINLGSIMGVVALAGRAPYASSKAGVISLTRVLALEWAGTGVTANALCPGPFGTDMNRQLLDDPVKYQEFVRRIPMGRWGEVDEITGPAIFLASDASSYMTGSTLFVDGGWTAW